GTLGVGGARLRRILGRLRGLLDVFGLGLRLRALSLRFGALALRLRALALRLLLVRHRSHSPGSLWSRRPGPWCTGVAPPAATRTFRAWAASRRSTGIRARACRPAAGARPPACHAPPAARTAGRWTDGPPPRARESRPAHPADAAWCDA